MMKISERYREEEMAESLALTLKNDKGNNDLVKEMENKAEEYSCDQCGYVDCVCTKDIS